MSVISPWVDMLTRPLADVVADLEAQQHRRFMKSHTPLDGLPFRDEVTYITVGRDPRDVALSWAHHMDNMDLDRFVTLRMEAVGLDDLAEVMPDGPPEPPPDDPLARFGAWVNADPDRKVDGLAQMLHHLQTFWDVRDRPNVHLFHYARMQTDLPGQIRRLAGALGVDVDDAAVAAMADAASFEHMRGQSDTLTPNTDHPFWKDTAAFFHRGTSGQWRELLSDADVAKYDALVTELAPADLVEWVHQEG